MSPKRGVGACNFYRSSDPDIVSAWIFASCLECVFTKLVALLYQMWLHAPTPQFGTPAYSYLYHW